MPTKEIGGMNGSENQPAIFFSCVTWLSTLHPFLYQFFSYDKHLFLYRNACFFFRSACLLLKFYNKIDCAHGIKREMNGVTVQIESIIQLKCSLIYLYIVDVEWSEMFFNWNQFAIQFHDWQRWISFYSYTIFYIFNSKRLCVGNHAAAFLPSSLHLLTIDISIQLTLECKHFTKHSSCKCNCCRQLICLYTCDLLWIFLLIFRNFSFIAWHVELWCTFSTNNR